MIRTATLVAVAALSATPTGLAAQTAAAADPRDANLTAYVELLRSDVRAQKAAILTELMAFTDAEDAAFWPIYREYDAEMSKLGDERVALIGDYAKHFDDMTDETADKLATKAIELESRRRAAAATCYDRVKKALSPRTALRFLQVEHQLQQLIDLQISAALPVVSKRSGT